MKDFDVIKNKLLKLFNNDEEKIIMWLNNKNDYFFKQTPFEVILQGDGRSIIELLDQRLGLTKGIDNGV